MILNKRRIVLGEPDFIRWKPLKGDWALPEVRCSPCSLGGKVSDHVDEAARAGADLLGPTGCRVSKKQEASIISLQGNKPCQQLK